MNAGVKEPSINEYCHFDEVKVSADIEKAKEYFERIEGIELPIFKVNIRIHNLLQDFIIGGIRYRYPGRIICLIGSYSQAFRLGVLHMLKRKKKEGTSSNYHYVANAFSVIDIAEPIRVFIEPEVSKLEVWEDLMSSEYGDWFAVVRDDHRIYGYFALDSEELEGDLEIDTAKNAAESCEPITPDMIVSNTTSLFELISMFMDNYFYFVLDRNEISHIVTFNDLDKLPFKISLFSLLIELESSLIDLILSSEIPLHQFILKLSDKRQSEIVKLCIEKYDFYSPYSALLSTNFIDKKKMISSNKELMSKLGFTSKTQLNKVFDPVNEVRNRVAHSNSILEYLKTREELNSFIKSVQGLNLNVIQALGNKIKSV